MAAGGIVRVSAIGGTGMTDLIYLTLGLLLIGAMGLYARALTRA